ncbi:polymorphic toxin type 24 domain-containing protein [Nocardia flavorosea]|uniref:Bacterial toxin 24 domain-containing protein n=1 Tax=Nocardia flavorosea TaxID=53429 RepID=A0A846YFM9_9NOCA|nr:polymorphic toxin type 24 domain-containing protein [Nocardia flavorosea]NKY55958.1 hypothetical protein [Nocardia flavorosea]
MNFINVDPATYYEAAKIVNQAASAFFTTYAQQLKGLESTNEMAGSAGPGKDWAISYDQQARDTNNLVTALTMLADRYTTALNQIGHIYALGDHDPTTGTPPPAKPPNPPLAFSSCPVPPPSAGGPGSGLVDDGLDLARKIGIDLPVPDGNTDKLHTAATVWKALAHAPEITNFPAELERAAALFQTVTAPDVDTIDDDLRSMKTAAEDLIAIFTDLANECAHQEGAHDKMRVDLQDVLGWFAEELRDYALVTAAFAVAASFLSFGVGGAAVTAVRAGKAVDLVNDTIAKLRHIVTVAGLRKAVALSRNTTDTRTKLERIHDAIETAEDTVEASASEPGLAQKLATAQVWKNGNLPVVNGPPNGYIVKRDANGNITNYSYYDEDGVATSRVDLTGKPHLDKQTGQYIPVPHVVEVQKNVNPKTGEIFARTLSDTVRPALPQEIP